MYRYSLGFFNGYIELSQHLSYYKDLYACNEIVRDDAIETSIALVGNANVSLRELSFLILGTGAEKCLEGYQTSLPCAIGLPTKFCQFMMGYQHFDKLPTINIVYMLSVKYLLFPKNMNQMLIFQNKCSHAKSYLK